MSSCIGSHHQLYKNVSRPFNVVESSWEPYQYQKHNSFWDTLFFSWAELFFWLQPEWCIGQPELFFGFSLCPVTYAIWYLHIKCFEVSKASIGLASFPLWIIWLWWSQRLHWVVKTTCMKCIMSSIIICLDRMQFCSHCFRGFCWSSEVFMDNSWKML